MSLDFFKGENELCQKTKEELLKDIENIEVENEVIIKELKSREKAYFTKHMTNLVDFLTKKLNFLLTTDDKSKKIYKFVKNEEVYAIEITDLFITYTKPKSRVSNRFDVCYQDNNLFFQSLREDEYLNSYNSSYSSYKQNRDISQLLIECKKSNEVLIENKRQYIEIKELDEEEIFIFEIEVDKNTGENKKLRYNNLVDFIKEIL
jgi:hypothetical protein